MRESFAESPAVIEEISYFVWQYVLAHARLAIEKDVGLDAILNMSDAECDNLFDEYLFRKPHSMKSFEEAFWHCAYDLTQDVIEYLKPAEISFDELGRWIGLQSVTIKDAESFIVQPGKILLDKAEIEKIIQLANLTRELAPQSERINELKILVEDLLRNLKPQRLLSKIGRPSGPAYYDTSADFRPKVELAYKDCWDRDAKRPSQEIVALELGISEATLKRYLKAFRVSWPPV